MALEVAAGIWGLTRTNPDGADAKSSGDDHIRLVKGALLDTFKSVGATVNASHTELNHLVGVTSAVQTQLDSKAPTASPTLTGTATAANVTVTGVLAVTGIASGVTEAAGSNNTRFATTEFVQTAVAGAAGAAGVSRMESLFYAGF